MRVFLRLLVAVVVSISIACAATTDSEQTTKTSTKASSKSSSNTNQKSKTAKKSQPNKSAKQSNDKKPESKAGSNQSDSKAGSKPAKQKQLAKLVDLGADKCIPCKKMKPILDELGKDYKGKLEVVFIDVWKDAAAGEKYKIRSIPTQIFYDAKGKELSRHEGFFSKEDILGRFKEHGIELKK